MVEKKIKNKPEFEDLLKKTFMRTKPSGLGAKTNGLPIWGRIFEISFHGAHGSRRSAEHTLTLHATNECPNNSLFARFRNGGKPNTTRKVRRLGE